MFDVSLVFLKKIKKQESINRSKCRDITSSPNLQNPKLTKNCKALSGPLSRCSRVTVSEVVLMRGSGSPSRSRWNLWCQLTVTSKVMRTKTASWPCQTRQTQVSAARGRSPASRGCLLGRPQRWTPRPSTLPSPIKLGFG